MWNSEGLIIAFEAETVINDYSFVAAGTAQGLAAQATDATAPVLGAVGIIGAPAVGRTCDVILTQIATIRAGGAIAFGDLVAAGADGKAVAASANDHVAGMALEAATAENDLIPVLLSARGITA